MICSLTPRVCGAVAPLRVSYAEKRRGGAAYLALIRVLQRGGYALLVSRCRYRPAELREGAPPEEAESGTKTVRE